ncbi:MAG: DUF1648 domain-containing protein [Planctomycetota bacterium]
MTPRPSLLALWIATALVAAMIAVHYDDLPDRVASHFDAGGNVDGHSSKAGFALGILSIAAFDLFFFAALGLFLRRLPNHLINVPHRDYWLAPERREATLVAMTDHMCWFGAVTQLLIAGVALLSMRASLAPPDAPPVYDHWILLGCYLSYTAFWVLQLLRRFPRPGQTSPSAPAS